jgi:hypothetical protein
MLAGHAYGRPLGGTQATVDLIDEAALAAHHARAFPRAGMTFGFAGAITQSEAESVAADLDPSDPDVARIEKKIDRGDLDEMSFAFRVTGQVWNDDYTEREITEVSLNRGDVSVVTFGANPATSATLRGLGVDSGELEDALDAIRSGNADSGQWALVQRASASLAQVVEKRALAGGLTFGDLQCLLDDSVKEAFGVDPDTYTWVRDFTDEWVVFHSDSPSDSEDYQVAYTINAEGTEVTFTGEPVAVQMHTTYVPEPAETEQNAAGPDPEELKRFLARRAECIARRDDSLTLV